MDPVEWTLDPWGRTVAVHLAWYLAGLALAAGLAFAVGHAFYLRLRSGPKEFEPAGAGPAQADVPERVPRHTLAARAFHWVMAAAMLALLLTGFLPKAGLHFPWVTFHWIAGAVLAASILFHVVHASFWLDFGSIWPDRIDWADAMRRMRRSLGGTAPPPRKFAKYPLENKLYHLAVVVAGLAVIATGVFMMFRVRTAFLPRNPYLLGDGAWGTVYVLHGLAGVGLITLVVVHVYFGLRPEKRPITKSMIVGWMSREFYLEEHDASRWGGGPASSTGSPGAIGRGDGEGDGGAVRRR